MGDQSCERGQALLETTVQQPGGSPRGTLTDETYESRPTWKRVFVTAFWVLLLFVPLAGIWALLRPYWNERTSSRARWFNAVIILAALTFAALRVLNEPLVLPGVPLFDALAGTAGFIAWFTWLHLTWPTTEA